MLREFARKGSRPAGRAAAFAFVALALAGCSTARTTSDGVCTRVGVLAATCPAGSTRLDVNGVAMSGPASRAPAATRLPTDEARPAAQAPAPTITATAPPRAEARAPVDPPPSRAASAPPTSPSRETTASLPPAVVAAPASSRRPTSPTARSLSMAEAVVLAIRDHPEIGMGRSRLAESAAGVRGARAGLFPQADVRFTMGQGTPITPDGDNGSVEAGASVSSQRTGSVTVRQLVYDFGATRSEILRSRHLAEAERFRLLDRIEEVTLRTVNAYLRVLEQRELIALADQNVAAHRRIAELVRANQREGNSTVADVSRVAARLVEAQTQRTNLDNELQAAIDQLRRLTKVEAGPLRRPAALAERIPRTADEAIALVQETSPRLRALALNSSSIRAEITGQRAQQMPRVNFELEGSVRDYTAPVSRTESEMRGMVVLRHRLFDGGARSAQIQQAGSRLNENEFRLQNERDELEANVRQFYRAIDSSRRKLASLNEGVRSSLRVQELYTEQFKAGKRTLFEVLDAQQSLTNARRDQIANQFEEVRATHGLLRVMGALSEQVVRE
jgi:TolC family type I secretion outer membrane protein